MDRLMQICAFALLTGFLAILVYTVPRWDLGAVVLVTLAFAAWDMISTKAGRN